jgi:protein-tyrosine-phosphatase
VPGVLALAGPGEALGQLRAGFTTFFTGPLVVPALLIGFFYACLYRFGTAIYLHPRENTFCVPLNRCASLLSGVAASYILTVVSGLSPPSISQLAGTGIIFAALGFLMVSSLEPQRRAGHALAQRVFLFVCAGNTSRSPMAQILCNEEIARWLGLAPDQLAGAPIMALSAGLSARGGQPLSAAAARTLRGLGVAPQPHAARDITSAMVEQAETIFCMTEAQRRTLVERFPAASAKARLLDPDGHDIDDPSGADDDAYRRLGERLRELTRHQLRPVLAGWGGSA